MTSTVCHLTPAHYISMGDFECLASETVHCGSDSQQQHEILPHTHYRGLQLSKNTGAKGEQHKMQQGDRDQTCPLSGKTFLQVRALNSNSAQLEGPKIFLCFQQGLQGTFQLNYRGRQGTTHPEGTTEQTQHNQGWPISFHNDNGNCVKTLCQARTRTEVCGQRHSCGISLEVMK